MEIFRAISAVVVDKEQSIVAIMDVPDRPGIAGQVTAALAALNIGIDMIVQSFHPAAGTNSISFTVKNDDLEETVEALKSLKEKLDAGEVRVDSKCARVSLVGAGLVGHPDIAARFFTTLGDNDINIKMISTSEMKISCIVERGQADRAVELLHDVFELGKEEEAGAVGR